MSRITFNTMYNTVMNNVSKNEAKKNALQEQMSSGQRINRPSDDPVGFTNSLEYRSTISTREQQKKNMDDGQSYMNILETSHSSINTIFQRSRELAVQASTDTNSAKERRYINDEVREELDDLLAVANTKHKGDYIFSGKWTDQKPYEFKDGTALLDGVPTVGGGAVRIYDANYQDPNVTPGVPNANGEPLVQRIIPGTFSLTAPGTTTEGVDYEVDYVNGTVTALTAAGATALAGGIDFEYVYRNSLDLSGDVYREVESGINIKVNANPDETFGTDGGMDAFKSMISLMEGLWENNQPAIESSMSNIDQSRELNLSQRAVTGARINRVEVTYERSEQCITENTRMQSEVESVDLAEAYSSFTMADAVYQVSLQSATRLLQQSIMDYL
jgi:flagellar hook-associated protein 3 FlgL